MRHDKESYEGEIFELKAELNNEKKEKRKEAVKKVIAAMTVGKDEVQIEMVAWEMTLSSRAPDAAVLKGISQDDSPAALLEPPVKSQPGFLLLSCLLKLDTVLSGKSTLIYATRTSISISLFPDVVNCMQTDNLELKKLVYLYLMNYAKSQPDMAIMAVNSFVKDCEDPNPLIRALAVRTMGCIRVDKITEYLCEPLRKCLKDEDPYVRKTAAVCVAKLHDINAQMVEDQGFLDSLRDLIADSNPMVISFCFYKESNVGVVRLLHMVAALPQQILDSLTKECNECFQGKTILRKITFFLSESRLKFGGIIGGCFDRRPTSQLLNFPPFDLSVFLSLHIEKANTSPPQAPEQLARATEAPKKEEKLGLQDQENSEHSLVSLPQNVSENVTGLTDRVVSYFRQLVTKTGCVLAAIDKNRHLAFRCNILVVANAVAALSEISESHPNSNLLDLNPQNINKLLTALNECTEWGQIFILDCLSNYNPKDDREAQSICERVTPRLSHANSAVVLSAVKVLMKFLELLPKDSDYYNMLLKKLAPPLVTLLSGEPEVQYVALRNINLIVQKRPEILKQEIKVFFVKYNDPIYVKLEKLDIMIRLASQANIAQVLAELKEYATEVDVDFVRKAVRAIGRCAIKRQDNT
ncbi:hypothetical protein P7K49_011151 [Saguinus oedipus]|uniref:Clathrin/coatomer adaptor adaptin-like N-terminal domain-containing protein n=1 Tax=Saguinus oedipus TaxID=9490 RepID=A0ABQ9VQL5_SAGOE|nr:hypothetical protein P7K49_011151 [Saguinus oedipus]